METWLLNASHMKAVPGRKSDVKDAEWIAQLLEDASIKLSSVASSLTTASVRSMLHAMIAGESSPEAFADLAKGKMRREIPDLAEALTGHFDTDHAGLAHSILRRLEMVEPPWRRSTSPWPGRAVPGITRSPC